MDLPVFTNILIWLLVFNDPSFQTSAWAVDKGNRPAKELLEGSGLISGMLRPNSHTWTYYNLMVAGIYEDTEAIHSIVS